MHNQTELITPLLSGRISQLNKKLIYVEVIYITSNMAGKRLQEC